MKAWLTALHLALPLALLALLGSQLHFDDQEKNLHLHGAALFLVLGGLVAWTLSAWRRERQHAREVSAEARFRLYFENSIIGMAVTDIHRRWKSVNPALCAIFGYSEEELLRKSSPEMTHPDDLAASEAEFAQILRGDSNGFEQEKRYIRADGQVIDTRISAQAVRRANGQLDSLLFIIEDITARKATEAALRTSEARLRHLGDNLPNSYVYQCAQKPGEPLKFLYVSSGVRLVHGVEPEEVVENPDLFPLLVDPAQLPALHAAQEASRKTLQDFAIELRVRKGGGSDWGWVSLRSRPHREPSGTVTWDGVATDITARRHAYALLDLQARRSEALLALPKLCHDLGESEFLQQALEMIEDLTDSSIAFMHFVDPRTDHMELAACSMLTPRHYCSPGFGTPFPLSQAGRWAAAAREQKPVIINDYANVTDKAGLSEGDTPLRCLVSVPVLDEGSVRLLTGIGNKMEPYSSTDVETIQLVANEAWHLVRQRRAEAALRIADQIVHASQAVFFRWQAAPGWPVVFASENVTQWGYTVGGLLAGDPPFTAMVHPDDLPRVAEEVRQYCEAGATDYYQEYRLLTAEHQVLWVEDRTAVQRDEAGNVVFFDGVLTDITRRKLQEQELADNLAAQRVLNKRLEEAHNQLLQSEKMASIGQLAAGIAHELNNPIGFVHSNLGTLDSYLRDLMDIIDAYDAAATAAGENFPQQAALQRLKEERDFTFLREDIVQLVIESKDGLARVRKIVQDLKTFSHVSEQDWQWADLHQGLDSTLNIVWNELKYKCTVVKEYGDIPQVYCLISQLNQVFMNLLVNASHAIESKGTITLRTSRRGEDQVCIEITDTGKGIAPEHLSRIFEPFFTTKPVGKGTGLGLSLSYGIVDRHQGHIEVDSQVGVGTCFRVILPIQPGTATSTTSTNASNSAVQPNPEASP
ncbi:MAG TPA: PAS domain S-box protein [Azospira sp.]|nr:PAS domain S-box protein [Azospira sp.]